MTPSDDASWRLVGLGLSAMLVPLGSTMIAVALPAIGQEFARTPGELTQWLVNSYLLINIVALGPGGKLADHWGYRRTLRLGQWLFGAGCLLPLAFHRFEALVAARILMALGGATMVPTVMAVFKITVPEETRHRVFGYFSAMMGFAAAVGPSLGGLLVHRFGWDAIFLMNLPPLLLSVALSMGFFSHAPREPSARYVGFDWAGSLLLALALVCLVIGMKAHSVLLTPALVLMVAFIWWQTRSPHPLIDPKLFSNRSFAAGCAIVALQNLAMYSLLFQLPYLLKLLYQWGAEQSGRYMTVFMCSMMIASMLGGRLAELVGVRATCVGGTLTALSGVVGLSMLSPDVAPPYAAGALVLGGAGLGLANGPSQSAAMADIERGASGIASGVISLCRYVGGMVGISVLASFLSAPVSAQSLAQYRLAILVFAGAFFVAALVSLLLPAREARASR